MLNLSPQICVLCAKISFGQCLCGLAAQTHEIQFATHIDQRHVTTYAGIEDHGHYNIPILIDEKIFGVIVLYLPQNHQTSAREVEFLQAFANIVSSIIQRKRAELALSESESRFRQLVENASDMIYRTDPTGRFTYINPVGLRMMGYASEADALGKLAFDMAAPEWRREVQQFYQQQLTQGIPSTYFEFLAYNQRGEQLWIGQNVQTITENGKITGFQAVARDITNLKQALDALVLSRDQALEANRFKSQLLARVSHELRTPLSAVMGYAELLNLDDFGALTADQRDAVGQITQSATYLNKLINDLLDQAQAESQTILLKNEPFPVMALLTNIRSGMEVLAQRKGLAFHTELSPDLPEWLLGDEQRLQQVIVNLIGNAIKFTSQGQIGLRFYLYNATQWAIEVRDTGAGIPPEAQTYIFEPFRQVNNAITRENRGTGLGLSITRQLVQLMGGEIHLQSEVGKGSTFTVTLPLTPYNS